MTACANRQRLAAARQCRLPVRQSKPQPSEPAADTGKSIQKKRGADGQARVVRPECDDSCSKHAPIAAPLSTPLAQAANASKRAPDAAARGLLAAGQPPRAGGCGHSAAAGWLQRRGRQDGSCGVRQPPGAQCWTDSAPQQQQQHAALLPPRRLAAVARPDAAVRWCRTSASTTSSPRWVDCSVHHPALPHISCARAWLHACILRTESAHVRVCTDRLGQQRDQQIFQ